MPSYGEPLFQPVAVTDLLATGLARWPERPGLVTADRRYSWRALDEVSRAWALRLLDAGLAPGDRVASLLPNCGALFVHYLATLRAGLVAVPLNYRYTPPEIDHALAVSGARAFLYAAEREADVAASARAGDVALRIVHGDATGGTHRFESMLASPAPSVAFRPMDPAAPAFVFFTSGSTGPAKGVTHSHASLGWMIAIQAQAKQLTPDDVALPASSCSHVGGFLMVLAAWARGAPAVVPPAGDMPAVLAMLREWRPTILVMLPAALFGLERDAGATAADFASLRVVLCGGDKVPEQLEDEFVAKTGLPISELYGMTEIGLAHYNPSSGLVKRGSIGRPAPGFTAVLRDDAGDEVPRGEPGRLWVRSPSIMPYYWNDEAATAAVWRDGWFDTGDLMRVDAQGYFWFCGRKKQLIVHDGSNIFPQEVEDALLAHDAVEAAGVVGIHDTVHGENVRAYVTLRAGAPRPSASALVAFARARVGYKAPEEVVVLDAMPINPTGKVDRVVLKRLAAADHATA